MGGELECGQHVRRPGVVGLTHCPSCTGTKVGLSTFATNYYWIYVFNKWCPWHSVLTAAALGSPSFPGNQNQKIKLVFSLMFDSPIVFILMFPVWSLAQCWKLSVFFMKWGGFSTIVTVFHNRIWFFFVAWKRPLVQCLVELSSNISRLPTYMTFFPSEHHHATRTCNARSPHMDLKMLFDKQLHGSVLWSDVRG